VVARLSSLVVASVLAGLHPASASAVTVRTAQFQLGAVALRDVSVAVRDVGAGYETCVTAKISGASVSACGALRLVNGQLLVRRGHARLVIPGQDGDGATLATTTVVADLSGNLSRLELDLRGTATTARVELHSGHASATLRQLALPFAVHTSLANGELQIAEAAPLIVRVGGAMVAAFGATVELAPTITLHAGWPHWRAEIAWTGVALGAVLSTATGGRVVGTGALDGELAFRGNGTNATLVRGVANAAGGDLKLTDGAWIGRLAASARGQDLSIHRRIAATLADFAYSRLALVFGTDPAVQISLDGRGKRIAQDLDLVVNVRSLP